MTIERAFASDPIGLTATGYTQVNSMTLTPGSGDYLAVFSMDIQMEDPSGSNWLYVQIYVNGVAQTHSARRLQQDTSIDGQHTPIFSAAKVSPGAAEVVEVKYYITTGATWTGTNRELTLFPASDIIQDADAVTDTIATATWTTVDNMTETPASGTYLLVFSTSSVTTSNEVVGYRVSVGGTPVAHSVRHMMCESSGVVPYSVVIACEVNPNGSQVVEIEWSRITGTGTQTCYERSMILVPTASGDIKEASGTVADADSVADTDVAIDDLLITDPGAADWLALFSSYDYVGSLGSGEDANHKYTIYEGGAAVSGIDRVHAKEDSLDNQYNAVWSGGRITIAGGTDDVQMYWQSPLTNERTIYTRTLVIIREPEAGGTKDATRRAEVISTEVGNVTRRAEVSPTLLVDDMRRAEVSPLEVDDITRRAEVSPVELEDLTRRAEIAVATTVDDVRRAEVSTGLAGDVTRRSSVTVVAWFNTSWECRKKLTLDSTLVAADHTNFPVLIVRTTDSDLAYKARSDAYDIVFTDKTGTVQLYHEIDEFTKSTGKLIAWVNVTSLSSSTDTVLYMYYGNSGASDQQDKDNTWKSSYTAVWHLGEDDLTDSSGNIHNLTNQGTVNTTGKIGDARDFTYTDPDELYRSDHDDFTFGNGTVDQPFSVSAWIDIDDTGEDKAIISKYNAGNSNREWVFIVSSVGERPYFILFAQGLSADALACRGNTQFTTVGGPYHVVATYDGSEDYTKMELYVNGSLDTPYNFNDELGTYTAMANKDGEPTVGGEHSAAGPFDGMIDEPRVMSEELTANWISTEFENQDDPTTFLKTVGSQESIVVESVRRASVTVVGWFNSSWECRKKLTLDSSLVAADHTDFPVLIYRATDDGLADKARSDAYDIVFTEENGVTQLKHEIDEFTKSDGKLLAWVKVTSLSSSTDTVLYMYYGNSGASDQQDKDNTWRSEYKGVWHLAPDDFTDSSGNTHDGTNQGTSNTTGKIGGGKIADDLEHIEVADHADFSFGNGTVDEPFSVSFWFETSYEDVNNYQLMKVDTNQWEWLFRQNDNNRAYSLLYSQNTTGSAILAYTALDTVLIADGLQLFHYTYDGSESETGLEIYIDGNSEKTVDTEIGTYVAMTGNNAPVTIHHDNLGTGGILDEVRVYAGELSDNWISTEYENQSAPGTFLKTVGAQESTVGEARRRAILYSDLSVVRRAEVEVSAETLVDDVRRSEVNVHPEWYNGEWTCRKRIAIDNTYVAADHTDFPTIIHMSADADLLARAQASGNDILFTDKDGLTKLSHEIALFSAGGTLLAWIKVPSLSSSQDTILYMYYGNRDAPDQSDEDNTWESEYLGVYHFEVNDFDDHSGNNRSASNSGTIDANGWYSDCRQYDQTGDYIDFGDNDAWSFGNGTTDTPFTFQFIYRALVEDTSSYLVDKYATDKEEYFIQHGGASNNLAMNLYSQNATGNYLRRYSSANSLLIADGWQLITVTYDGTEDYTGINCYINGSVDNAGGTEVGTYVAMDNETESLQFAMSFITGYFDEIRILSEELDANWVTTTYNNYDEVTGWKTVDDNICGAPEFRRRAGVATAVTDEDVRRAEVEVSTEAVVDDVRRAEVIATEVKDVTREAVVYVLIVEDIDRRAIIDVATTKDITRRAIIYVVREEDITRGVEVSPVELIDDVRRAEVSPTEVWDLTRRAEVIATEVKEPVRRAEVSVAATEDVTREASISAAVTGDVDRRARVDVQALKDVVREAVIYVVRGEDLTREAQVSPLLLVDEERRAEVTALEVDDLTREASITVATTKEPVRRSSITVAGAQDITRRAEIQAMREEDLTRRAHISPLELDDLTRRAEVAHAAVPDLTREASIYITKLEDLTRRAEIHVEITVDDVRRAEVAATGDADVTREVSITVYAGYNLAGVTKDSAGSPLGSCDCYLIKDNLDNTITYTDYVLSNVSTGVYTFTNIADNDPQYMVVAFKDGTPNRMDVTDHVLQPVLP